MTKTRIDKLIEKWQNILHLSDWKIDYKFVDFKRADNYPQKGDIEVNTQTKIAIILLKEDQQDIENTIVHELVHLMLWDLDHYAERQLLNNQKDKYLELLESTVTNLTKIFKEM